MNLQITIIKQNITELEEKDSKLRVMFYKCEQRLTEVEDRLGQTDGLLQQAISEIKQLKD